MKKSLLFVCCLLIFAAGCSLPPERPFTKQELYKTGVYNYYTINESPESVLAAINKDGEVVLEAKYKDRPIFIKILGMNSGLQVYVIEK